MLSPSSSASSEGVPSCALTRSSSELLCDCWPGAPLPPAAACRCVPAGEARAGDADPGEGVQRCGCRGCVCSWVPCWITSSRLVPCASELLSCSDALRLKPLPCAWPPARPQMRSHYAALGESTPLPRPFIDHLALIAMDRKSQCRALTVLTVKQCIEHRGLRQG